MVSNDDEILELLEKKLEEAKRAVVRFERALAALRGQQEDSRAVSDESLPTTAGVIPPIEDICRYLRKSEKPVYQNEIIRTVGAERQTRYPSLTNHYSNIWRALEYHVRHHRMIACVDPTSGRPVLLKPLPPRPKGRKLHNDPANYEQDNWFVLLEQVTERQVPPPSAEAAHP